MTSARLHPVILSGGSGTRLWPLSRTAYPKQLLALLGDDTLLQTTVRRAEALASAALEVAPPLLICNADHRFLIREQLAAINTVPDAIYLEPVGRNTAPAIALAAFHWAATAGDDAVMLVSPADHVIADTAAFARAVVAATEAARAGQLVTFGMTATRPDTAYGYIRQGSRWAAAATDLPLYRVAQFVEKPDEATARDYLGTGEYAWNSGIFVFTAGAYLAALQRHRPEIHDAVQAAFVGRQRDLEFIRPEPTAFRACPAEAIDTAVMQVTDQAVVVPVEMGWCDIGAWDALWAVAPHDIHGNASYGDVVAHDTHNSYLRAEHRLVTVIGLDDVVVIETADAVLVMPKHRSQDVKTVLNQWAKTGRREPQEHRRVYRPWGWYEGIDADDRFQVKRLMVKPGERLSLQRHYHRAEHWVVVRGTAKITIDGREQLLGENQSAYIPLGHVHRLENPGKIPLHLIEVQSGAYLGEDDIERFDDQYGRLPPAL